VCEAGRLYDTLGLGRRSPKVRTLVAFYSPDGGKKARLSKTKARLRELWPPLMAATAKIKKRDHRRLARLAQNLEATVMIHWVVNRIRTERPDILVLPRHDSIGTTPENVEFVESVIREE
jgi:hypothetical protein